MRTLTQLHRLEQGARIARGLGLGLSIVERLARVLNHGIALDSNVSGGSFFSVTVPIASAVVANGQVVVVRALAPLVEPAMDLLQRLRAAWRGHFWQLPAANPRIWAM